MLWEIDVIFSVGHFRDKKSWKVDTYAVQTGCVRIETVSSVLHFNVHENKLSLLLWVIT